MSDSDLPFCSVIVPVFNDATRLQIMLSAIANQDYPVDRIECILVDNGSDVPLAVNPEQYPFACHVFKEPRPGSYAARNRGLRAAQGTVLAFTDSDCVPRSNWLSAAVAELAMANKPTILAGHVEVFIPEGREPTVFDFYSMVKDINQKRFANVKHFSATANMVTNRSTFDLAGEFDGDLRSSGDKEWGQRAHALGADVVYARDVVVAHPSRSTLRAWIKKNRRLAGGAMDARRNDRFPLLGTIRLILQLHTLRLIWNSPKIPSFVLRLRVILVELVLKSVSICEAIRLRLGGASRRS